MPFRAATSAALPAAKAVPLREPLNPDDPELPQDNTLPCVSVKVTIVLLNVEAIWARPTGIDFRSLRRPLLFGGIILLLIKTSLAQSDFLNQVDNAREAASISSQQPDDARRPSFEVLFES